MNEDEKRALAERVEKLFCYNRKTVEEAVNELFAKGVPNGCFQDYYLLSLITGVISCIEVIVGHHEEEEQSNG